ncbi:MAG: NAD(P)(+) transhydrogenase (Re/Si-specific) subunit alpha, partial [Tenericutes bacterium HGW-Tenericutes-7]
MKRKVLFVASLVLATATFAQDGLTSKKGEAIFKESNVLIKINPFTEEDLKLVQKGQILMSQLYYLSNPALIKAISETGATAFSMDAMPRISRAQDMDVLSSQSNLAGYKAV